VTQHRVTDNRTRWADPEGQRSYWRPYWSPRGDAVFFVLAGGLWMARPGGDSATRLLPADWDRDVVQIVSNATGDGIWTTGDGGSLYITTHDQVTKNAGFYRIEVTTGRAIRLREEARRYGYDFQTPLVSAGGESIVYVVEDAQHPPDVWVAGPELGNARQLTHLNPSLSAVSFGTSQIVSYLGVGGQLLRGALLLPPHYVHGRRYPLVVCLYPGPYRHSDDVNRFGFENGPVIGNMQLLATRGYVVLYPEAPQRLGEPMRDLFESVNAAVTKVIDLGIADPERLGVLGFSYGGYATLSVIVQTTRFRAAVTYGGMGDLLGIYGNMSPNGSDINVGWSETTQGLMGGSPWSFRDRYIENSPFFYLDRVKTPLLMLHGDKDDAVPPWLADQVFVGLRRLGQPVEYRKYQGEGHSVSDEANMVDLWMAVLRWFDTHLQPHGE
jgi:dipeptidyl aminopeptidase/acylaminoacyl peptidase